MGYAIIPIVIMFIISAVITSIKKSADQDRYKERNSQTKTTDSTIQFLNGETEDKIFNSYYTKPEPVQNKQQKAKSTETLADEARKKQPKKAAVMQPRVQVSIADHMHGTTTATSAENCKKSHNPPPSIDLENHAYDLKTVKEYALEVSNDDIAKAVLLGEVINTPAFKKRR